MKKIAFAVHGGASSMTPFLRKNMKGCEEGLVQAAKTGYRILQKGGSALEAVETAIILLEDNPLFNAGRGSALNCKGEIEMDASIMNGKNLKAGAVSMVRRVKNPIVLARHIMNETKHVCLSGYGALELAESSGICLELDDYFITPHQFELFQKYNQFALRKMVRRKMHGTVGAVAVDKRGHLAAGTSTGGTSNSLPGRTGDSCVIGAGCYANNKTCAVSGTGEGEYLIRGVVAHTIAMMVENGMALQAACDQVLHKRQENCRGEIGVIAVDPQGNIGISFNTSIMKRAWISSDVALQVKILP